MPVAFDSSIVVLCCRPYAPRRRRRVVTESWPSWAQRARDVRGQLATKRGWGGLARNGLYYMKRTCSLAWKAAMGE